MSRCPSCKHDAHQPGRCAAMRPAFGSADVFTGEPTYRCQCGAHTIKTPTTLAEVEALADVIKARIRSNPQTPAEWRAIVRHADRIARLGRAVLRSGIPS